MITNKLKFFAVALSLVLFSSVAMATTLTNSDGSFANFGGIDWMSNGTAIVDGYDPSVLNSTFDLTYYASAATILDPVGVILPGPTVGLLFGNYEYTIFAIMNETSTCNSFNPGCVDADFAINSGTFTIYYDTTPDANMVTGGGITDGIPIIMGTIFAQDGGGFDVITGGNATLQALITFTDSNYINPDLLASTATTTLQIGENVTGWADPTSMPGAGGGTMSLPAGYLALQADANQDFTAIPEPGTLVLLGLGLTGLAVINRRRK